MAQKGTKAKEIKGGGLHRLQKSNKGIYYLGAFSEMLSQTLLICVSVWTEGFARGLMIGWLGWITNCFHQRKNPAVFHVNKESCDLYKGSQNQVPGWSDSSSNNIHEHKPHKIQLTFVSFGWHIKGKIRINEERLWMLLYRVQEGHWMSTKLR